MTDVKTTGDSARESAGDSGQPPQNAVEKRGRGNIPGPMWKTLRIKEPEPMTPEEARMIRKALGLSIRQMCRLIGFHETSWSAIHHWETGRSKVPKYFCLLLRLLFFCRGTRVGEKLGI